jgi:4'-phosphopantetheinyl transferase
MQTNTTDWRRPPEDLTLGPEDVHVWRAALLPPPSDFARFEALLTDDELRRADRFRFEGGRENYVHGKAVLRILLGRYSGTDPSSLRFIQGEYGKPYLPNDNPVKFNMSDSHGLALFAFARGREIGVDLELIRPDMPCERIAKRHFTGKEYADLMAHPPAERVAAFFTAWTRKEAYLKAVGAGLYKPLNSFEVSLKSDDPPTLREIAQDRLSERGWTLAPLYPSERYCGAVVVEGTDPRISCLEWS